MHPMKDQLEQATKALRDTRLVFSLLLNPCYSITSLSKFRNFFTHVKVIFLGLDRLKESG